MFRMNAYRNFKIPATCLLDNKSTTNMRDVTLKIPPWLYVFSLMGISQIHRL